MMESACLRHTEIPHTTPLFSDFQYHFDRLARFYAHNPHDPSSYAAAAKAVEYPAERRAALVEALRTRNAASESLKLLAKPGTMAVVTGQQVGLFSGPAYTIYKALTAVRLAERLSEQGIPAVPIFWLATEDHDLAEVSQSFVFGADQRPVGLTANGLGASERPVGEIAIADPPLGRLHDVLAGLPYADDVLEMVRDTYPPGATFGAAFHALLERLLAGRGLLFVDPLQDAVHHLAAPLLREVVSRDDDLHRMLLDRNGELEAAGYHAQVHVEPKTSLVFLLEGGRRIALRRQNGEYVSKERRYSAAELLDRIEDLSPNALLRPVMQDYVLPTIAYVGGPSELAYMAQSQVLYRDLLGRMPVMLSRAGFTLLDARAAKLMDRYGFSLPDVFHGEERVRDQIGGKLVPPELIGEFGAIERATADSLARLRDDLVSFDSTLAAAADKSRTKILYQLSKIERKTARETVRKNQRAGEEAAYLSGLIFPEKHLQERLYSILPFVAKHGPGLTDTLYENISLDCPDHRVLVI
ncbi:MAG TPA: bacillithiol biosynthesis cysteine-adding enzyme BshC [Bryobacteraceae bacterium]|nr:bacillithiol biosynthesis cysteine-adding enzyme BshC [Bryobacteraceae bacterium]